ncbi:MAG: TIGR01777 family oxidoreductase [Solirubrobacterales bacterium]
MRVLVTGATGLIGSAVCDALLARGEEVVGLSRDPAKARTTNPTVSWHAWDPANERPPEAAFEGVDAVVNLIGEEINQRLTDEAKRRIRDSRVRATKNLVDGMLAANPQPATLISQAAIGIYGDRGEAIVDESTPPGDGFLPQIVVEWENEARRAAGPGVRVVIFRTGLVLDPDGGLLKQLGLPFKLGLGGPLAGGGFYMPWIHRDDEVGLILWALDTPQVSGTLNATAPNPVTNRELSQALGRALHRPSLIPAPRLAIVAMRGEELTEQITGSYRVIPRRAQDLGYAFRFTDVDAALADLYR